MKGGIFTRLTRNPLIAPMPAPNISPISRLNSAGSAVAEGELPHDDRTEHRERADREIDAGGQDHQGLRGGENADDLNLLEDQRQRAGGEEPLPEQQPEQGDRHDENDERHEGRIDVQRVLEPAQQPASGHRRTARPPCPDLVFTTSS